MKMPKILEALLQTPTASGAEQYARQTLQTALAPFADEITTDACGNLQALRRSAAFQGSSDNTDAPAKKIALFCAMDAPGLIVTYPEENGLVRVAPLGNVGADKQTDFAAVRFCTVSDGTRTGVLLPNKADENPREAHVDFGFADGCEAKQIVAPGDPLYLCPPPVPLAGDLLYAPALGNKLCAAALCLAFEKNGRLPESDLQVVFCAQTALGNRGASSAAYAVTPDFALCLEPYEGTVPGVKVFDRSLVCDEALTDALREAARQCGTELMSVVAPEENSDAARVHAAGAGVPTAVLLLPVGHRGALLERAHTDTVFTLAAIIEKFLNNR